MKGYMYYGAGLCGECGKILMFRDRSKKIKRGWRDCPMCDAARAVLVSYCSTERYITLMNDGAVLVYDA